MPGGFVRPARAEDMAFVENSWLQSYADSDTALICTPKDEPHTRKCQICGAYRVRTAKAGKEYWNGERALMRALIRRSVLLVKEASDGLLDGFACWQQRPDGFFVHYVYVRMSARCKGVAKELLSPLLGEPLVVYTHRSRVVDARRMPKNFRFDPYELYRSIAA